MFRSETTTEVSELASVSWDTISKVPRQCLFWRLLGAREVRCRGVRRLTQSAPAQTDSWSGPGLPNLETGLSSVHPKPHGWLKDAKTSNVGRIPDPLLFKSLSSSITVKVNTLSIFPPLSSFQGLITTATQLPMEQGTPWDLTFHRRMIARVYFLWSSDFSFSFSDDITVSWFTSRWITDRFLMVICAVTMWNLNSPPGEDSFAGVLVFSFFPFVDRFRVYLPSAART